jgi:hypothetical protein
VNPRGIILLLGLVFLDLGIEERKGGLNKQKQEQHKIINNDRIEIMVMKTVLKNVASVAYKVGLLPSLD